MSNLKQVDSCEHLKDKKKSEPYKGNISKKSRFFRFTKKKKNNNDDKKKKI